VRTIKAPIKRAQAVSALGLIVGNPMAVETAERALYDSNSDVCRAAVIALGDMNSRASVPKIKALLKHSDAKIVVAIAVVLKKSNDPQPYDIYHEITTKS
jgi:HEAT repeat protein